MENIKVSVIIPVYNQEELVIKALDSIPVRDDIEVIVIDDGSTDDTWSVLLEYHKQTSLNNFILLYNEENKGVAHTVNRGYDVANGEYVVLLGSDDYFITIEFIKALSCLNGRDLVYFNLEVNNGDIWRLNPDTKLGYCGSVKFMRRAFIGDTRNPEDKKAGEDYYFYNQLLAKNPTEIFTNLVVKHYNYPRQGSLTNLSLEGKLNEEL